MEASQQDGSSILPPAGSRFGSVLHCQIVLSIQDFNFVVVDILEI